MITASYLGLKEELPPYLDWSLGAEQLMTGVSFGSAGSGYDPMTAKIGVISLSLQNKFLTTFNELEIKITELQS